jgi:AraC-like DNA-binding protein
MNEEVDAQSFPHCTQSIEIKSGLNMVKIGQNGVMKKSLDITSVGFNPPSDTRLAVEAMSIADLRKRAPREHFEKLQRADFYRLIGVLNGQTSPMVDFSTYAAQAGDWLLVRPGQVFRYDFSRPWGGWLLVFRADSLSATVHSGSGDDFDLLRRVEELACNRSLDSEQHGWMIRCMQQMQYDGTLMQDVALRNELLRLALNSSLLRLALWHSPATGSGIDPSVRHANFRRFRKLLDADFATEHKVQHYANALGMSDKTLSRVCLVAAGVPAKALINQRLLLEAKRLLAHTTLTVQTIGRDLGFEEATNFVKFFRKEAGVAPLAFRGSLTAITTL